MKKSKKIPQTYRKGCTTTHTNALEMGAKHACNSYKCITTLIVTGTRHYYAGWAWSCTNFVHGARTQRAKRPLCASTTQGLLTRMSIFQTSAGVGDLQGEDTDSEVSDSQKYARKTFPAYQHSRFLQNSTTESSRSVITLCCGAAWRRQLHGHVACSEWDTHWQRW